MPTLDKLPKRLTISFPLWTIYATKGEYSPYYDIEKLIIENVERGFNCIRIDDGAGLIHDINGNRLAPFDIHDIFGEYEKVPRQLHIVGDGGKCDLLERLFETCRMAKKHGVYIILSSWYYLHSFWMHGKDDPVCSELFALPYHERIGAFTKFLHYILCELEKEELTDCIAFCEIFNEINDLPFMNDDPELRDSVSDEEREQFRIEHKNGVAFLREQHPDILFAYDTAAPVDGNDGMLPENMQVYNFHNYFMWDYYDIITARHPEWFFDNVKREEVERSREGRMPAKDDWYERVTLYNNLDESRMEEIEAEFEASFDEYARYYRDKLDDMVTAVKERTFNYPNVPIVCGEGVSYICHKRLLWEEHSEKYWSLIEYALNKYKEAGLWGTVIRTCCAPEDPSWELCKDKLLKLNTLFKE